MKPIRWPLFVFLLVTLTACRTTGPVVTPRGFAGEVGKIAGRLSENETIAVSYFYDSITGNVTQLGNQWRNRTQKALIEKGAFVKSREEIGVLIEDVQSFGIGKEEKEIWEQAGAHVVISGSYVILKSPSEGKQQEIRIHIKALRVADSSVIQAITWQEALEPGWTKAASVVKGNMFHKKLGRFHGPDEGDIPNLSASLDRDPPCYLPAASGKIHATTEPGVHLYLFNLAADNTVTLLYPNVKLPDQPLPSAKFEFPPPAFDRQIKMVFYPMKEGESSQEAVKVVASRQLLDFSFLPVPINRLYYGAEGGDIKKMLYVLKNARDWREVTLNYAVGVDCR